MKYYNKQVFVDYHAFFKVFLSKAIILWWRFIVLLKHNKALIVLRTNNLG